MLSNFIRYCFFLSLILLSLSVKTQNLVYNGSFEIREYTYHDYDSTNCPCTGGRGYDDSHPQLKIATGWYDPIGVHNYEKSSSDYFHSCGNDTNNFPLWYSYNVSRVGVPKSYWMVGYQYPRTGEGFTSSASPGLLYWNQEFGEYIQSKLVSQLEAGKTYKVRFHTVRGNMGGQSIETLGAYLSSNDIDYPNLITNLVTGNLNPQLRNSSGHISDTLNWTKIEGEFVAIGNEQYITIGNMDLVEYYPRIEDSTAIKFLFAVYAYDDVSVYEVDAPFWTANAGDDISICLGDSIELGKTNVPTQYKNEYFYEWFIAGDENNIISHLENPVFTPLITTTYVLKLTDFKYDKTYDTIRVEVDLCGTDIEAKVYPNPAYDWVKFKFNTLLPTNTKIQIYDIAGSLVQEQEFNPTSEQTELEMQLNNLAQGVYGYSVLFDDERVTGGKLIILR